MFHVGSEVGKKVSIILGMTSLMSCKKRCVCCTPRVQGKHDSERLILLRFSVTRVRTYDIKCMFCAILNSSLAISLQIETVFPKREMLSTSGVVRVIYTKI